MPRARVQFCPQGHDTFAGGRSKYGSCLQCHREGYRNRSLGKAADIPRRPADEIVAVNLAVQLLGPEAMALREECARRGGVPPSRLAREIIQTVIRDRLFSAVLDP